MFEIEFLADMIGQFDVKLSGPIVYSPSEVDLFYAFIKTELNEKGVEVPSKSSLLEISGFLQAQGFTVNFIRTGGSYQDAEAGIRAIVSRTIPNDILYCFMSVDAGVASVWITPKRALSEIESSLLRAKIEDYLSDIDLKLDQIILTLDENLPSKFACLTYIRIKAPIGLPQIVEAMKSRGFDVPSNEWMSKHLDNIRKGGLITRLKSGGYAVSLSGLKALGSAKDRTSPDITRVLDLARRVR
ncbi:hypothetical protein [Methylobacterium sp. Leaf112]|uniref:hypothetical protein n=1 Tax=Methylobacterium sp. Leaf112 TaxID=1736258 RepID=UPI000ACB5F2D|nr:hypothetical protein [Methylobacterium sp. Leaf112]